MEFIKKKDGVTPGYEGYKVCNDLQTKQTATFVRSKHQFEMQRQLTLF